VTVLAGGVGAARFLRGLCSLLDPRHITVIVNTADDESFFGLHVSPDLDTVTYTLAGRVDRKQGWGLARDSFACLHSLGTFYPETWFRLGDRDLATHIHRTESLRRGEPLSRIARRIAQRLGVETKILPMSDDRVRTVVHVAERGALPFQEYLVKGRGRGRVEKIRLVGAGRARPAPGVLSALQRADVIILPPSNPLVSIFPILAVRGVRDALRNARAPVAAVSPLVNGKPIKGPLHRMLDGLGHEVSAVGVAKLYRGLVDLFVLDKHDAHLAPRIEELGMHPMVTNIVMHTPAQSRFLAAGVMAEVLARGRRRPAGRRR